MLPFLCESYDVYFQTINGALPAISSLNFKKQKHATSVFKWNYNAAVIQAPANQSADKFSLSLLVRCQNQGNSGPFSVTPSVLALTYASKLSLSFLHLRLHSYFSFLSFHFVC
jgi:hypothetical protein